MADERVTDVLTTGLQSERRNGNRGNRLFDADKGVINTANMLKDMEKAAAKIEKMYEKGTKAAEIIKSATNSVVQDIEEISHGKDNRRIEKEAKKTAYQDAINKSNDPAVRDKLRTKEREEELKANKEFNKQQLKEMKDSFSNIAHGLFTFNPREMSDAFKSLKENLKETSKQYGGAGKAAAVGLVKGLDKAVQGLSNFSKALNNTISTIAGYKTAWDTRLYGSDKNHSSIADLVKNNLAISPYVKQSKVMEKLNVAIDQGISYNVEQRAFLGAISESIATTFDAFDTTLKDLVRVQQADSTAYRLGMEASLNEYLNKMFESTEYLTNVSDTVTSNLYQATSLLEASQAIGYEYQVQKWLGSLYSVGMSQSSVTSISQALGQLLSGDVSGTESGAGKLLVMAAANAGVDYAKLLTDGINDSDINILMGSMVQYLQQIASDNKVVQSQMANIFGLQTADIQAATNLKGFLTDIYNTNSDYSSTSALGMLNTMMSSIGNRMSLAQKLENLTDNFKYTLAEGIAANPALYSVYTISNLLDEMVGGIKLPTISVFGNSVDLNATVADLLRMGALTGSVMDGFGAIFSGLGELGKGLGGAYDKFSATSNANVRIGKGFGYTSNQNDISMLSMNYKANRSTDDFTNANAALVEDSKNEAAVAAGMEEQEYTTDDLYEQNERMEQFWKEVSDGSKTLKVELSATDIEQFFSAFLDKYSQH